MLGSPMSPPALVKALRQETPDEGILVVDAGNSGVWSHLWRVRRSDRYLKPVGFGNMGFALRPPWPPRWWTRSAPSWRSSATGRSA